MLLCSGFPAAYAFWVGGTALGSDTTRAAAHSGSGSSTAARAGHLPAAPAMCSIVCRGDHHSDGTRCCSRIGRRWLRRWPFGDEYSTISTSSSSARRRVHEVWSAVARSAAPGRRRSQVSACRVGRGDGQCASSLGTHVPDDERASIRAALKVAQPRTAPVLMDGFLPSGDEHAVLHLGSELSGHEELAQGG